MEVINQVGIQWRVVRVWPDGGYELERELKLRHNGPKLCPVCNPAVADLMGEVPGVVVAPGADLLDVGAFNAWLVRWSEVEVGWSDEPLNCPLGSWLKDAYGGEWHVNAGLYRWREQEWIGWGKWQALPPWAVVFLDRLYRQFGNAPVLGAIAAEALQWSLADIDYWQCGL